MRQKGTTGGTMTKAGDIVTGRQVGSVLNGYSLSLGDYAGDWIAG